MNFPSLFQYGLVPHLKKKCVKKSNVCLGETYYFITKKVHLSNIKIFVYFEKKQMKINTWLYYETFL